MQGLRPFVVINAMAKNAKARAVPLPAGADRAEASVNTIMTKKEMRWSSGMTNTANMQKPITRAVAGPTCGWKAPPRKIMSSGREITQAIPLTMKSRKEGHQALC
mmetsp:Transcript_18204/g.42368  ORF Transcript_18204/g.42368 Transcript_18204/m.42368 type:complete len:105 (+) Transcript_18204:903-1217(+)